MTLKNGPAVQGWEGNPISKKGQGESAEELGRNPTKVKESTQTVLGEGKQSGNEGGWKTHKGGYFSEDYISVTSSPRGGGGTTPIGPKQEGKPKND